MTNLHDSCYDRCLTVWVVKTVFSIHYDAQSVKKFAEHNEVTKISTSEAKPQMINAFPWKCTVDLLYQIVGTVYGKDGGYPFLILSTWAHLFD